MIRYSSKQGRKLSDAGDQEKASTETEPIIQEVTPTEVIQDQGSSEKGNSKVSTARATKGLLVNVPVCLYSSEKISTAEKLGDDSSKNYKILSEMLEDFDRQDVMDLHMLVKERYSASRLEGYDLMLWGDLHNLFEPDEEDEIWKNQHVKI
ncbi:hypothetical protein Tco_0327759 [Tanacetum coccineum]